MTRIHLPETLEEVWSIMDREPGIKVYAGGTDLLVRLRRMPEACESLICIERVTEIQGVTEEGDEIVIGAGTTHSRLLEDPIIQRHAAILCRGLEMLGSPPIRHMGTIGGNVANASPAADSLPPLYVLRAFVEIRSRSETRTVPIDRFINGPGQAQIGPHELLTRIRFAKPRGFGIHHYEKIGRRKAQACAVASMAALVAQSPDGLVEEIRLSWGSVGPTVVTCEEVEDAIRGRTLVPATLQSAAGLVEHAVAPIDDVRASAEYRRLVAGNLLLRLAQYREKAFTAEIAEGAERK
ncbi:MAG: FAD binding domain-containing protein [Thermodesulfobacteriota bacterium]